MHWDIKWDFDSFSWIIKLDNVFMLNIILILRWNMRVLDETHDSSRYSRTRWHKQGHERVSDRTALPKHTQYKQESASCRKLMEITQKQHLRVLDDQWLDAENNRTHVMWSTAIQFDKWRYIKTETLCYCVKKSKKRLLNDCSYDNMIKTTMSFCNTFKSEVCCSGLLLVEYQVTPPQHQNISWYVLSDHSKKNWLLAFIYILMNKYII